jgi:hypothetical protein
MSPSVSLRQLQQGTYDELNNYIPLRVSSLRTSQLNQTK